MSKIGCFILMTILCLLLGIFPVKSISAQKQNLTVDELLAEHVKSIGSPAAIAEIKSRALVGTASVNFIQGAHGSMNGTSMVVSEGNKLGIVMKYSDINYPGEYFAFDGKDVSVGYISPGQRSPVADFLFRYNGLFKEGLMGGILSGAWPLLDLKQKNADLKYRETTVEGRRLHEIEYQPKQTLRDMKIRMYFEPESCRHVRTEYQVRIRDDMSAAPAGGQTRSGRFQTPGGDSGSGFETLRQGLPDSIYVLVEKFDDFKKVGGLILPHSYTIHYSVEGQGGSFIAEWTMKAQQWAFNKSYDERIFKAQK